MTIGGSLDNGRSWLDAAGRLEAILNNLEFLAGREDRMREIVAARRDLTAEIGATGVLIDGTTCPLDLRSDARRRLSGVRHIVSLHQATWPVVRARESPQAYRRSAQDATLALRDFIAWLRAQDFEIEDGF
jgi:hypothetical protein